MTLNQKRFLPVPDVIVETLVEVDTLGELATYLEQRKVGQAYPTEDDEGNVNGIEWHHVIQGFQRANIGQVVVVMRDGLAQVYDQSLSDVRGHQEVEVGETGRVSLDTTPL